MKAKSNTTRPPRRTRKHPDFPLTKHPRGYWCKKVKGKLHYFGKIADDPDGQAALERWLDVKDDLLAGRKPRDHKSGGLTVADAGDWFCNSKRLANEAGEITKRTLAEYVSTCNRLARVFGANRLVADLRPEDFEQLRAEIAKSWGPHRTASEVSRVRSVFKWLFESQLIEKPINFGPSFKKPPKRIMRLQRASGPVKMFEPNEIHTLLGAADVQLRAMILLGCNLGFGNHDCGGLPLDALDLKTGRLDWARPKTGVQRRGFLWPETIAALRAAIAARPQPTVPEAENCVFVTKGGKPWTHGDATYNSVSSLFNQLQDDAGLHLQGRGFYALRHTFETVSGECCDQVATDLVMGHADQSMAANYRERVADSRIRRVCDHVRAWLFGQAVEDNQPAVVKFSSAG